jgi:hypothetical protein
MSAVAAVDPFIVLALPRSRSAWLAHWLSYPGKFVGHDISIECKSVDEFLASYRNGMAGTVETGAMIGWRLLKHELPGLRTLVVMRDVHDVLCSLAKQGVASPAVTDEIASRAYMLAAISAAPGVKTIDWQDLNDPFLREALWDWLLQIPFDPDWDARFAFTNIQIDFAARLRQLEKNRSAIEAFKAEVINRQQMIGLENCPMFN